MRIITDQDCLNWGLSTKEFLLKHGETVTTDVLLSLLEELEINIRIINMPVIGYFVSVGNGVGKYEAKGEELTVKQVRDLLFDLTLGYVEQGIKYNTKKLGK